MRAKSPLRPHLLLLAAFAIACTASASDSKKTADYYLITPADFAGKSVTLDVGFVKPVRFQSPVPDVSFFHVITIDKRENRPGGEILVAVASDQAAAFASRYGTNRSGMQTKSLTGTLLGSTVKEPGNNRPEGARPGPGPGPGPKHHGIWFVDTTGKLAELISTKKLEFDPEAANPSGDGGGPMGGPGMKPHRPGL